jgi:hypothetical protein
VPAGITSGSLSAVKLTTVSAAGRNESIVGTWKLIAALITAEAGESRPMLGEDPSGILTYTSDGRMTVVLASGGRPPLSVEDSVAAPAAERAEAFSTFCAYAGRYTFEGDRITHHVEVSWFQNWVGTDQIRFVKRLGNRLTLSAPSLSVGGQQVAAEILWERLSSAARESEANETSHDHNWR